jgi:hypothetical protein
VTPWRSSPNISSSGTPAWQASRIGRRGLLAKPVACRVQVGRDVDLVQDEEIGGLDLPLHRIAQTSIGRAFAHVDAVDQHDHPVTLQARLQFGEICDATGIGHTRRLDDDMIEPFGTFQQANQRGHQ